jgi:hypothetical protein
MFGYHPPPTPLALAIAWGVTKTLGCHSLPPCARNRVGVYDDARSPPSAPLALAIARGVYHDTRLPPTP